MTFEKNVISIIVRMILFLSFIAGIVGCIYLISQGSLSDRESAMLGILLTILSTFASWIITDVYADSQYRATIKEVREEHRNNLRTYALKAAEKVNNLSNELNKLSIYLEEELNYTDYRSTEEELLAKEERIESAIHLTRTLKSVNDTALSDWEGVIGEELDQRREEQQEKEEELMALIERIESEVEGQRQGTQIDTKTVRQEVERLRRDLRLAMSQLIDTKIPRRVRKKEPKQDVVTTCPLCHVELEYKQRGSARSIKLIPCKHCGGKLVSTYSEPNGFSLKPRQQEVVHADCPNCGTQNTVPVDNFPSSSVVVSCSSCKVSFRILRTLEGTEIRPIVHAMQLPTSSPKNILTEDIINRVREVLPPQPWPTGTHRVVAVQLNMPQKTVRSAVEELIRRGVFYVQHDGKLYAPIPGRNRDETENT